MIREIIKACEEAIAPGVSPERARILAEAALFFGLFVGGSAIAWIGRIVLTVLKSRSFVVPPRSDPPGDAKVNSD